METTVTRLLAASSVLALMLAYAPARAANPLYDPFIDLRNGFNLPETAFAPGSSAVSILASAAKCDGVEDETALLNAWLPTLPVGTTVTLPPGALCLFTSGDVTIPPFIKISALGARPGSSGVVKGTGFVHDPLHRLFLSSGDVWEGGAVIRSDDGFHHQNPTTAQALGDVFQWWNEYSEGVSQVAGSLFIKVHNMYVEGFHIGYASYTGDADIDGLNGDCSTLFADFSSGDSNYLRALRNEPLYSESLPITGGAWQRYGASYYFGNGSSWNIQGAQSEGWPLAYVVQGVITAVNITSEYPSNWSTSPNGFPAEQFGVAFHETYGAVNLSVQGFSFSSGGFDGVFSDGIVADSANFAVMFAHGIISSTPSTGNVAYVSGGTAAPSVINITAIPAVGQTVSATVAGSSITAVGGPFTINYVIKSGDTAARVAQRLTYLLNTQRSELAHAHTFASQRNSNGTSTFSYYWPADSTVTITLSSNLSPSVTTGSAVSGGALSLHDVDLFQDNQGGIALGNTTGSRALVVALGDLRWASTNADLPTNWLTWSQAPERLVLGGISWSSVATADLNGTGGTGAAVAGNSTDEIGTVTEGTSSTGFVLTFRTPYPAAPKCVVSGPALLTSVATTTALTVTNTSANGQVYNYQCKLSVN